MAKQLVLSQELTDALIHHLQILAHNDLIELPRQLVQAMEELGENQIVENFKEQLTKITTNYNNLCVPSLENGIAVAMSYPELAEKIKGLKMNEQGTRVAGATELGREAVIDASEI